MDDYEDFKHKYSLKDSEILYMGDDIPDLEVMKTVGFAVCPADAVAEIKAVSKYISQKEGGNACVREVLEMVLKEQGKWVKTV
jgi:3-deoxy-D-manno-octulosonate 8-phosphate phosphatase (KDO 8-P phosphatase)